MQFADGSKLVMTFAVSLLFVFAFFFSTFVLAQTDSSTKTVDQMMQQIMGEQHVAASQIDCTKVSNDEFEQLGDAVMDRMIGNSQLHARMDAMMGGEGSQSLTNMHIAMGANWLGCATNLQGAAGAGMMGGGFGGMMGGNYFNGYMGNMMSNMMGYYYPAYYSSYGDLLIWTLIGWVLFVVMFIVSIFLWTGRIEIKKKRK